MDRVLITGGEGCLASHLATAFRGAGAEVLAPGRGELDVTSEASVTGYFRNAGRIDLLIANAGTSVDQLLARTTADEWDHQLEVNLHGAFRCARAGVPAMVEAGRGHVIFLSSGAAVHPPAGLAAYAAAKAGLLGLSRSLARELGPHHIRVNTILPGFFDSPMTAGIAPERRASILRDHSLGRFNDPASVAAFAVHLHRHLPHTSGQVFQLDSRVG